MDLVFLDNKEVRYGSKRAKAIYKEKDDYEQSCIHDYSKGFEYNKEFYDPYWLQNWAEKKIFHGKNIKQLLAYEGQTLWYFFEYMLYADVTGIAGTGTGQCLYYIDLIEKIIATHKPKKITVQNNNDVFYKLVSEVAKKKKIPVKNLGLDGKHRKHLWEINPILNSYLIFRFLTRSILGLFSKKQPKKDVVMISGHRFCKGKPEKNTFWGPVVKELEKQGVSNKIIEYEGFWNLDGFRRMLDRHFLKSFGTEYIGKYYGMTVLRDAIKIKRFVSRQWRVIKNDESFKKSLAYKQINIHEYVQQRFDVLFESFSLFYAEIMAVTKSILKEKPKTVVLEHEYSYYGLGILNNSKKIKTNTVALEFESVNTRTSVHRHIALKEALNKKSSVWRPLADAKCASGLYTKKILEKNCNVASSSIVVTGQPRFDLEHPSRRNYEGEKIRKELGIGKEKIILYGTKYRDHEDPVFNKIIEYVNSKKNLCLVFKVAPNTTLYKIKERIKETKKVKIIQDYDVFKLLYVCDLFITDRSTMGSEAIAMDKPLLIFDFYKICQFPYVELGAGFEVNDIKNLSKSIEKCLNDKKTKESLNRGREKFVKEYLNGFKGDSSKRVVKVIKKIEKRDEQMRLQKVI